MKEDKQARLCKWSEDWRDWQHSGLTQREYAERQGLNYYTFKDRIRTIYREAPELVNGNVLSKSDYYGLEYQRKYLGYSQYKSFSECEARTMAELRGDWSRETSKAFLVGLYVDNHFTDDLEQFKRERPEIFTRSGELKAEFRQAEKIIERIEQDPLMMEYLRGQHQSVMVARLFPGIAPFKIRMDSYLPDRAIVDLKILKDFDPVYVDGMGKVDFVEAYGYDIQGAIYQAVEQRITGRKDPLPFIIAAASKQDPPDIRLFEIPQYKLDAALKIVEATIDRVQAVKIGAVEPERCEKCAYCRATRILKGIEVLDGE